VRGFVLDSHVPKSLAAAVESLAPDCVVVHLSQWRDGSLLHAADEEIIRAATEEDLVLVSYDLATIPETVSRMVDAGAHLTGVVLFSSPAEQGAVGSLARPLVRLFSYPEHIDPAYPVVYLRP
jgi:hypothetical protein